LKMKQVQSSHRKRMEACLNGEISDRVPVALWRHFPVDDQQPESLAKAIISFQQIFDFDIVKVTPASSYCLKDRGMKDTWRGSAEGTRDYLEPVIRHSEDWTHLKPIDPTSGWLGDQLKCLRILVDEISADVPVIQTIFSPLAQAKNLAGKENLYKFLREYPDAVHEGMEILTQDTIRFIEEISKTGIDGIFYAIQHASYDLLSIPEFLEFGKYYDLQVLDSSKHFWLNMLHIHGENIMFDQVQDYPVNILNWHDRHTPPGLDDALKKFQGVLCGGLRRWETMVLGTSNDVNQEALDAIRLTQGKRFILGTGCVLPIITPYGNILSARQTVERADII
jgi:uroporphyrinogen decarboxylase